jgi:hypothetical protein
LRLSFNREKLWLTLNKPNDSSREILSEREEKVKCVELQSLLSNGSLQTSDPDDMLRKFQLALRLASSLHVLCLGPWIQQDWTAKYVRILENPAGKPIEMLDEAYISCDLTKETERVNIFPRASQQEQTEEIPPKFFLSFAQLLIDIEKGESSPSSSKEEAPEQWYDLLVEEHNNNFGDGVMEHYRKAIEGCLLSRSRYEIETQFVENEDLRVQKVQEVIRANIVVHLRNHLDIWKEQRSSKHAARKDEPSHSYDKAQRSGSTQSQEDHTPEFTLWGDPDDEYKELYVDSRQWFH